jgi:hypothetical protein
MPRRTLQANHSQELTPIYIINRNRYSSTKRLIDWLVSVGEKDITILDNDSTYFPLLAYYEHLPKGVKLICNKVNAGPYVLWEKKMHYDIKVPYIVSDSDIVPADCCPKDLVTKMKTLLTKVSKYYRKIGPGLRIDNIPDSFPGKGVVLAYQQKFWQQKVGECFEGEIDTTFAIYRPGRRVANSGDLALRMDMPYVVEHTPWYVSTLDDEEKYYIANVEKWSTFVQAARDNQWYIKGE